MRRLFGRSKEVEKPPPAPTLSEATAKIDQQVEGLEEKIKKADAEIKELVAKGATNPTAKARAMQAMKRKKMYEQQRDQLLGTQFNVEQLAFQQEQAEITQTAVAAMQAGTTQLKTATAQININSVDKLTDDMADLADEMQQINEALASASGMADPSADAELEDEYAKMEEELAAMTLSGLSQSAASSSGVAGATPAEKEPAASEPDKHQALAMPSAPP